MSVYLKTEYSEKRYGIDKQDLVYFKTLEAIVDDEMMIDQNIDYVVPSVTEEQIQYFIMFFNAVKNKQPKEIQNLFFNMTKERPELFFTFGYIGDFLDCQILNQELMSVLFMFIRTSSVDTLRNLFQIPIAVNTIPHTEHITRKYNQMFTTCNDDQIQ